MGTIAKRRQGQGLIAQKVELLGLISEVGWQAPASGLTKEQWAAEGTTLRRFESGISWAIGDWINYGKEQKEWGTFYDEALEKLDYKPGTLRQYSWVAGEFDLSNRLDKLSYLHHQLVASLPKAQRTRWLARAVKEDWSVNQLKAAIARQTAIDKTSEVEFEAKALGKYVVLYADPPWRYENPPMGGSNRSIENHYPTMELEEICALPVEEIAHENAVLFMWATSPKLAECMEVLTAWGFTHRTTMTWVKDSIGMGYHVRERHEILLIAKRGELPPPVPDARPDSVQEAPRLEHSAKPPKFYDIIDKMYPGVRKIELFGRAPEEREDWATWGNQAQAVEEAA